MVVVLLPQDSPTASVATSLVPATLTPATTPSPVTEVAMVVLRGGGKVLVVGVGLVVAVVVVAIVAALSKKTQRK